jgi:hypothetical protein
MRRWVFLILGLGIIWLTVSLVGSQSDQDPAVCQELVATAYESLGTACDRMPGGMACGGFGTAQTVSPAGANQPLAAGERRDLVEIRSITTDGLNLADVTWGATTVNIHANVPRVISEQGVRAFMLGAVSVENLVPPDQGVVPAEPVPVTSLLQANLRANPNIDSRVADNAPIGTKLTADGLSPDGEWLRVVKTGEPLWISRQLVSSELSLDDLPVLNDGDQSLMQTFCLSTGDDEPQCSAIPRSMLLIQTPQGFPVHLTINGVDLRAEATFVLWTTPERDMHLYVLAGAVYSGEVVFPLGFTARIHLAEGGCQPDGFWVDWRAINDEDRHLLNAVTNIPRNLLDYGITIPTDSQIADWQNAVSGALGSGTGDCGTLRPTSPLNRLPYGPITFYWDGVEGAINYWVYIQSGEGTHIGPYETGSSNTNISLGSNTFPGGPTYTWYVAAMFNDGTVCTSPSAQVLRDAAPAEEIPAGNPVQPSGGGGKPKPPPKATPPPTDTPSIPPTAGP